MPGHPVSQADEAATEASINTLTELIRSHDAVFLLMDSRESRWLPTVIGAAENKIVINAALGFDSWLVMRHGAGPSAEDDEAREAGTTKGRRLGCYYCNDIVAPADVSVRGGGFESTKLIVSCYAPVSHRSYPRSNVHCHSAWNCTDCSSLSGRAAHIADTASDGVGMAAVYVIGYGLTL
jgi:hypothetical protein